MYALAKPERIFTLQWQDIPEDPPQKDDRKDGPFKKKQITSVKFYKNDKYHFYRTLFIGNVDMILIYDKNL